MPLTAYFLDVGDCHSTFLQFADHTNLLVDCGSGDRTTAQHLRKISRLDHVVITHPHADHIRSLADLQGKVRTFNLIKLPTIQTPVPTRTSPISTPITTYGVTERSSPAAIHSRMTQGQQFVHSPPPLRRRQLTPRPS